MFDFMKMFNYMFNEFAYVYLGFYISDDLDSIGYADSSSTEEDSDRYSISNSELESDILLLSQINKKIKNKTEHKEPEETIEDDGKEEDEENEDEDYSNLDEDLEYEYGSDYEEYIKKYKDVFERNVRLVSIEGNIGAGKSTLVKTLQKRYSDRDDIYFLQEPVDLWEKIKDKDGKNMLQKFYDNPKKYAFAFQIMAYNTRLKILKEVLQDIPSNIRTIVMERSLDADHNVFAKMLHDEGLMESVEHDIYEMMANEGLESYCSDGFIWICTEPEQCFERVKERSRAGENSIDMNYLQKCHEYHVEWLGADLGMACIVETNDSEKDLDAMDRFLGI